jgi:hypothetical protein
VHHSTFLGSEADPADLAATVAKVAEGILAVTG